MAQESAYSFSDGGPLWEFLRHCRNAAAHNGKFYFKKGQPDKPAEWASIKLEASMHDLSLFDLPKVKGLLSVGDPIALLWDIEQAYPNLKA
jgi:hypothetical protein